MFLCLGCDASQSRHHIIVPADIGMAGRHDAEHLLHCVHDSRVFLSHNVKDFDPIHKLIVGCSGTHPGILLVRRDSDRSKNLNYKGIVSAIAKVETAYPDLSNELITLNDWRCPSERPRVRRRQDELDREANGIPSALVLQRSSTSNTENLMADRQSRNAATVANRMPPQDGQEKISRQQLIDLLNEDLAREYQAIIAYVVYSQVIKGAAYMNIAGELEKHAGQELQHAITIAQQIDYLGGMPTVAPKAVRTSADAKDMLRFDLENENETVRHYRQRVRQCEALGEYGMAEHIREILVQEQEHQIDLATALGVEVPDVTTAEERA